MYTIILCRHPMLKVSSPNAALPLSYIQELSGTHGDAVQADLSISISYNKW